jgi:hypothetical protein
LRVLAFGDLASARATQLDRFVASIYTEGREAGVWAQWLDGVRRAEWFSHALTALWGQCDTRARKIEDELGAVDFDVATLTPNNWVRKSDRENEIRYDLIWERTLGDRRRPFRDRT